MSPAIASVFPYDIFVLGGQQSARTIHFFVSVALLLFLLVHIMMIFFQPDQKDACDDDWPFRYK